MLCLLLGEQEEQITGPVLNVDGVILKEDKRKSRTTTSLVLWKR